MVATTALQKEPTPVQLLLDPSAAPKLDLGFADFLKREYDFSLIPNRPICKDYQHGHCPAGDRCPDRHPRISNYSNLICKHWLRGLCKKGNSCEFLHEYNLRLMPECTQFSRYGACTNGSDCLYLHIPPDAKLPACPHYDRGFCPLGPHCAKRHIKKKTFCPLYMAGFCPDGRTCKLGGHPKWSEKGDLPKPLVRIIKSKEELEAEKAAAEEKMAKEKEDQDRDREERGLPSRRGGFVPGGRGRGRGRGEWRGGDRGGGRGRGGHGGDRY